MATRTFWKGYLKLSLVNCPVTMAPATTESEKVRFHTMNAQTGNRVVSRLVDSVTGKPVRAQDEAKGFERAEDDYVLLDDDEIDSVALPSTRTIDIYKFVPADSVGWIWFDKPHFLSPASRVGEEAFSVIRAAMAETGTVGIARLVLYWRERTVMLKPRGKGIVVWTLRYGDEVRDAADYFRADDSGKPDPKLLALVKRLIKEREQPWRADMASDPVQDKLLELIASKKKRRRPAPKSKDAPAQKTNVVSIMDALKRSLAAERTSK